MRDKKNSTFFNSFNTKIFIYEKLDLFQLNNNNKAVLRSRRYK